MRRKFPTKIEVPTNVPVMAIIRAVTKVYEIPLAAIYKRRIRMCVDARHTAIVILRNSEKSTEEVAELFDILRSSVVHAQSVVPNKYESDKFFAAKFDKVMAHITAKYGKKELTLSDAKKLALETDYAKEMSKHSYVDCCRIGDAGNFFLEGYKHALNEFKSI